MRHLAVDDPDLPLDVLMKTWPETIAVFLRHKMTCVGCMINPFDTVIDACIAYKLDEDCFRAELQQAIAG
jgi:hybrid cluster-associated redox disulfide protein